MLCQPKIKLISRLLASESDALCPFCGHVPFHVPLQGEQRQHGLGWKTCKYKAINQLEWSQRKGLSGSDCNNLALLHKNT